MNDLGIHHHISLSKGVMQNIGYSKQISYGVLPFFKLYEKKDLKYIRQSIDTLMEKMPHKLQKVFHRFKPPSHIADNHYRSELKYLEYCEYNKIAFFIRVYHLRSKDFLKVEIVLCDETLGKGKYLNLQRSISQIEKIFEFIEQKSIPVSLFLHRDEYFFPQDLLLYTGVYENKLKLLIDCKNKLIRESLKETLRSELQDFQNNFKELAYQRLKFHRENIEMSKIYV